MAAVSTAASLSNVSTVSLSWGLTEGQDVLASDEAAYDSSFIAPGVTFVASTGDYGAADPLYPAFSPDVLAVGGTSLSLNSDNSYNGETGWFYYSTSLGAFIGSGGGISQYETEPAYQLGVQSTGYRTTPDVSFVADPATGAWIADPYNLDSSNPWEVAGGTSLSAPCWAGLIALVNQGRVAAGQPTLNSSSPTQTQQELYSLSQSDYNVINSGSNGYSAGPGYNLVTGLGTPVASLLVSDLVAGNFATTDQVAPISPAELVNSGGAGDNGAEPIHNVVFTALTATGFTNSSSPRNEIVPIGTTGRITTVADVTIPKPPQQAGQIPEANNRHIASDNTPLAVTMRNLGVLINGNIASNPGPERTLSFLIQSGTADKVAEIVLSIGGSSDDLSIRPTAVRQESWDTSRFRTTDQLFQGLNVLLAKGDLGLMQDHSMENAIDSRAESPLTGQAAQDIVLQQWSPHEECSVHPSAGQTLPNGVESGPAILFEAGDLIRDTLLALGAAVVFTARREGTREERLLKRKGSR
jgi:hypothetical protein